MFDTIAAISTPRGEGGISIVRISGNDSIERISFSSLSGCILRGLLGFILSIDVFI